MLDGVRVVDLSTEIAGPYCAKLFADAGAEVVKVEPRGGDPLRQWTASGGRPGPESGALFRFLNASKSSVIAGVGSSELRELVEGADILVESLAAGVIEESGLLDAQPRLVTVSISPFGHRGPWAHRPATEFTLQAWCGSTASRGRPDGPPIAAGGRIGEWVAGAYAAVAGLSAWWGSHRTGRGDHVDLSIFECMCVTMNTYSPIFASFLGWKRAPGPPRSIEIPSIEPTSDGYVGFCTITAQQFQDFLVLIERPDLVGDRELAQIQKRVTRMDEVLGIIHAWTTRHTAGEAIELASLLRIPVAPIGTGQAVLEMEQFVERGVFVEHPGGGFRQPRVPYRLHDRPPPPPPSPAPRLGADTGKVAWGGRAGATPPEPALNISAPSVPPRPLAGLRVVDFTAFWAGPAGTHMLAALGADVVKVESVQRPDGMRFTSLRPPSVDQWWEWCPVFHGANSNKRSVTLDMTRPEGQHLADRLLAGADAVMENFSPRVMEGFGMHWEALHARHPRLVMVRMPAFGLSGPWRDRTGFAQTMEQVSGMAWVTGLVDGPPLLPRGACDPMAGMHAAFALLVALQDRRLTGRGCLVELTMVEVALNAAAAQVVEHTAYGTLPTRLGNRGPSAAPQGLYRCNGDERWLALAVADDAQWSALVGVLGTPRWASDPGMATQEGRARSHDLIDGHIAAWCASRDVEVAAEALARAGVAAAVVVDPTDIGANPQLRARGLLEHVEHPVTGRHAIPGIPFRLASAPGPWLRRPPPTLGQHNEEVLGPIAGEERLAQLRGIDVVGERPLGSA